MQYRVKVWMIACLLPLLLGGCGTSAPEKVDPRIKYQAVLAELPVDADRSPDQLAVQARLVRRGLYRDKRGRLQSLRNTPARTGGRPAQPDIPAVRHGDTLPVEQPSVMLPLPE